MSTTTILLGDFSTQEVGAYKHQAVKLTSTTGQISQGVAFVLAGRYDDAAASGFEQSVFVNDQEENIENTADLVAGGVTRIGINTTSSAHPLDGMIGPVMLFPSSLTGDQILSFGEISDQWFVPWHSPRTGEIDVMTRSGYDLAGSVS
jgi:hypothetical protein